MSDKPIRAIEPFENLVLATKGRVNVCSWNSDNNKNKKMGDNIQIFLLRIFVVFLRFTGITFSKFQWKYRYWLMKDCMLCSMFIWSFRMMNEYRQAHYKGTQVIQITNNAFGKMIDLGSENMYIWCLILGFLCYSFNGHTILALLDSPIFMVAYPEDRRHRTIYVGILMAFCSYNLTFYLSFGAFFDRPEFPPSLVSLVKLYTMTMVNITDSLCFILMHYFRYGLNSVLKQSLEDLKTNRIGQRQCMQTIREMMEIMPKFYKSVSLLLLILIVRNNFYLMKSMFRLYQKESTIFQAFYAVSHLIYLIYLLDLGKCVKLTFQRLLQHLIIQNMDDDDDHDGGERGAATSTKTSRRRIRLMEMHEVYVEYFDLQIYDLFVFNGSFFLQMVVFVFGYFVLIIQTV